MPGAPIHPEWTEFDSTMASVEGWDLFPSIGGSKLKPFWLERRSQLGVFASDEEAWLHVWKRAQAGAALHQRALAFLQKHSPAEYAEIRRHGLGLNVQHNRFKPKEEQTHE